MGVRQGAARKGLVGILAALFVLALVATWLVRGSGGRTARNADAVPAEAPESTEPTPAVLVEAPVPESAEEAPAPVVPELSTRSEAVASVDADGEATLLVLVVSAETDEPLPDVPVLLNQVARRFRRSVEPSSEAEVVPGEMLRTDERGSARFRVPAGLPFQLRLGDGERTETAEISIGALAAGQTRTVRHALSSKPKVPWHGVALDRKTLTPLVGARVQYTEQDPFRLAPDGAADAWSAADGSFELLRPEWADGTVRVDHEGYAPGFVEIRKGPSDPASPVLVLLARAASVEGLVVDASDRPVPDVAVVLSAGPWELFHSGRLISMAPVTFEGRTDATGRCLLEGLPPDAALDVELRQDGHVLWQERGNLRLQPGEVRALRWSVGGSGSVTGRTLDGLGRPRGEVLVWAVPQAQYGTSGHFQGSEGGQVVARATSDAGGNFELTGLSFGSWKVGVAADQEIFPAAVPVELDVETPHREVTLTCWEDLFLEGTVQDPAGRPHQASVLVFREGVVLFENVPEGPFRIGPLPPGDYRLDARAPGSPDLCPSEPVVAAAGARELVLRLQNGARLSVRVVDAGGRAVPDARVWFLCQGELGRNSSTQTNGQGRAESQALAPDTYDVSASREAGEFAVVEGLQLSAGDSREIELRLEPGSLVSIDSENETETTPRHGFQILRDGRLLSFVFPGQHEAVVPPGTLEVRLYTFSPTGPLVRDTRTVRAEPGVAAHVVFDLSVLER